MHQIKDTIFGEIIHKNFVTLQKFNWRYFQHHCENKKGPCLSTRARIVYCSNLEGLKSVIRFKFYCFEIIFLMGGSSNIRLSRIEIFVCDGFRYNSMNFYVKRIPLIVIPIFFHRYDLLICIWR